MQSLTRRPGRVSLIAVVLSAILSATVLYTVASLSSPGTALGASVFEARCNDVALRTKPSTSSTKKAEIDAGKQVSVVSTVTGGSWRTTCAGQTVSGNTWYRINAVMGQSVSSRYGVTYVYVATGLLKPFEPFSSYAACNGVPLRTKATHSSTAKVKLSTGTKVTVVGKVIGGGYSHNCANRAVSGSTWYRISVVGSSSVSSRYGVSYLYAPGALFTSVKPSSSTPSPTPTPTASPTPTPTPKNAEGIDVSHWQGTIDWAKVKAAGKKFAYIKASEHTSFVDDKYQTNRANAKKNGILVGAYHFARPDSTSGDAAAEADHFIRTAAWVPGELLPVLDLEVTGGLSSSALQTWVKTFLERVYTKTGERAVIYVSPSFWSTKMANSTWFAKNGYEVLWVAHWTTGSSPSVPAESWGGKSWTFWQYTSDGSVAGIGGRVDLDRYRGQDFSRVIIP